MISARARTVVIAVVTAVWAMNFLAGVFINGYEPSESINGIFMAIVGGLFALGSRNGNGSSNGGSGGETRETTSSPSNPSVPSNGTPAPTLPTSGDDVS
jgi:hypothetical protein